MYTSSFYTCSIVVLNECEIHMWFSVIYDLRHIWKVPIYARI